MFLILQIADNRPRSSLALLSAASSDDEIDGWSDSMATPPVQWSQSPEGKHDYVFVHYYYHHLCGVELMHCNASWDTSGDFVSRCMYVLYHS